jgi:hypothetical protein
MIDLSKKKCLIYDRGLYTFLGQKLAESFGECFYFMPESSPYPGSALSQIGEGLDGVERIDDDMVWKCMDKSDMIFFPDCYDGEFQVWLKSKGYRVFGGLGSEKVEMDKMFFYEYLQKVGLPIPKTYRAEGLDDLIDHLKGKDERWLKRSYYRGDFETRKFRNMKQLEPWLDMIRAKIGRRATDIEILIQNPIKSVCEIGGDSFCINGNYAGNPLVGYEVKDEAYVGKIFEDMPDIISSIDERMSPLFKKLGYQGHYSNELRIMESGKAYFIDPTIRAPSPPSELMCEMYEDYPGICWQISGGEVPECKPKKDAVFGVEIILNSDWYVKNELCVEFPKDLEPHIKLKNQTKKNGVYYCIPNYENEGLFGGVIAYGKDLDKTIQEACDIMGQIECDGLNFNQSIFDRAKEQIEAGTKFGVVF